MHLRVPARLPFFALLSLAAAAPVSATLFEVTVTVTNPTPATGTMLTPVWVGFHNGGFDVFNAGASASPALERLAEDGDVGPLVSAFNASANAGVGGVIFGLNPSPPIFRPGAGNQMTFVLDSTNPNHAYFSYASMIIPSNDAFIGNDSPTAFRIFDQNGAFIPTAFNVTGDRVWDAGTEVNDEIPANTAAFGQMTPNTGVDQFSFVTAHSGFLNDGAILTARPESNFTVPGYQVAQFGITASAIPEPGASAAIAGALALAFLVTRRTRRT